MRFFKEYILKDKIFKNWQILLILMVSLCLRLYHLGYHDFWYDEIGTVDYAQHPWNNWNAPFYWILLHFWIKVFKISEFGLRFPSLVFSFFSIILVFLIGKRLFNKKAGLLASIFMGLSPFHIWYAQEARDYSMLLFWGTLSSWLLLKAIKKQRLKSWVIFTMVSIAGFYTNYFYTFLFVAHIIFVVTFFKRLKLKLKNLIPFFVVSLCFSLYLNRFLGKFFSVWQGFWIPEPEVRSLVITIENFILGYNANFPSYLIVSILIAVFFTIVIIKLKDIRFRPAIVFCLYLFLTPIVLAFLFSKTFFSVYLDRGLIVTSPYFYLILSFGVFSLNKRYLRTGSLVILFSLICIALYGYYMDWMPTSSFHYTGVHLKKSIKPVVKFIEDELRVRDRIVFTNESVLPSFRFYSPQERSFHFLFVPGEAFDPFSQRPVYENRYYLSTYNLRDFEFDRLWVISCDWSRDGSLDGNSQAVKDFLDRNFRLQFIREFDGLWVFRYDTF
ncbi:MAG: glycosyltransferase family 39 protein [Candidatus Omnitrophica bacterium]|nr:glycosyltransferase family 39 protein [Candidatus Omnitrophota bacterium]